MNKIEIALQSPATWSLIGVFLIGGLEAIVPSLHGTLLNIVQAVLAIYATFAVPHEIQKAGRAGAITGNY